MQNFKPDLKGHNQISRAAFSQHHSVKLVPTSRCFMQGILHHQHFSAPHFPGKKCKSQDLDDHTKGGLIFCSAHCNSDFKIHDKSVVLHQGNFLGKKETRKRNSSTDGRTSTVTDQQIFLYDRPIHKENNKVELYITSEVSHRDSSLSLLHLLLQAFRRIILCLVRFRVP